jgi:anthranilate 1,2-dioxygenase small subunit
MDLGRWPSFFTDDAVYRVISRENYDAGLSHAAIYCDGVGMIKDRAVAIAETSVYAPRAWRHFVSGVRLLAPAGDVAQVTAGGVAHATAGDVAHATANFAVIESMASSEPRVALVGRYVDTIEVGEQPWRLRQRDCVYDNYRIHTSLIVPV